MNSVKEKKDIAALQEEIAELKIQLYEANSIVEAIRENSVDALVLNKDGKSTIYSIESADYTYRILIEKFEVGALSISEEGLVLYCNAYFSRMVGIPANKITGTYFNSYIDSVGDFHQLKNGLEKGANSGEVILNIGGKKIYVHMSLTDLQPAVAAIGIVVTDLAEKRKQQEDLVQYQFNLELKVKELDTVNENLRQLIHIISHDLKEPLRKIIAYSTPAENLKQHTQSTGTGQFNSISASAGRINHLVEHLVKNVLNANEIVHEKVDLNETVQEVLEDLGLIIKEKSVRVNVTRLPEIYGAKVQLWQLFLNLIANAIRSRKNQLYPEVSITAEIVDCVDMSSPNKKFHCISIRDNGTEMDTAQRQVLSAMLGQQTPVKEFPVNGISLAICKKIVDQHSGKITVESFPGEGSLFNVYFPVKD